MLIVVAAKCCEWDNVPLQVCGAACGRTLRVCAILSQDGSEQSSTYRYESREMEHKHVSDDKPGERVGLLVQ